jgi:NAD+ synthase
MTNTLTITLVQASQRVGDLAGNADAMLAARAAAGATDLIVFPEMQMIGYPAEDLIAKPALAAQAAAELQRLALASTPKAAYCITPSPCVRMVQ